MWWKWTIHILVVLVVDPLGSDGSGMGGHQQALRAPIVSARLEVPRQGTGLTLRFVGRPYPALPKKKKKSHVYTSPRVITLQTPTDLVSAP